MTGEVNSAATLSVRIDTEQAVTDLGELEKKYVAVRGVLAEKIPASGLAASSEEVDKLKAAMQSVSAENEKLSAKMLRYDNDLKAAIATGVAQQMEKLKKHLVGIGGAVNDVSRKVFVSFDEMGDKYMSTTDRIIAETKRLSQNGVDVSQTIRSFERLDRAASQNVKTLEKYIKETELAEKALLSMSVGGDLKTVEQVAKKHYGSTILDEITNLPEKRKELDALKASLVDIKSMKFDNLGLDSLGTAKSRVGLHVVVG